MKNPQPRLKPELRYELREAGTHYREIEMNTLKYISCEEFLNDLVREALVDRYFKPHDYNTPLHHEQFDEQQTIDATRHCVWEL